MAIDSRTVINGTWGEVWLDDEKLGEQKGLQAKINFQKEDVDLPRSMAKHKKVVGWDGTGTLRLYKVNTRVAKKVQTLIKDGKDVRFTIVSKLADPDADGAERVVIRDVSFDDLTLVDFEPKKVLETEMPFTFTDYDFIDQI